MRPRILITALLALFTSACNDGTDWPLLFAQNSVVSAGVVAAADAQEVDRLGSGTAIDGDLAAFGAPNEDGGPGNPLPETGAVYTFRFLEDHWQSDVKLLAPSASVLQRFGQSVAISGNYLIAGSPGWAAGLGSAYVFLRDDTSGDWDTGVQLTFADPSGLAGIGNSVSISGDYAVVGGSNHDGGRGAAWIFERTGPGNAWSNGLRIQSADVQGGDSFGYSVAISGDRIVAGAPYEDGPSEQRPGAGAIYVFERTGPGNLWGAGSKLTPDDSTLEDHFGLAVDIDGTRLIAGAPDDDGPGANAALGAGSAYVFEYSGSAWMQSFKLEAPASLHDDGMGFSVSIDGDLAAVGAPNHDGATLNILGNNFEDDVGMVYVFGRFEDGTWGIRGLLFNPIGTLDDRMGFSVAVSGDFILTGAFEADGGFDNNTNKAGTGFFYRSPSTPPIICSPISWSCI